MNMCTKFEVDIVTGFLVGVPVAVEHLLFLSVLSV